MYLIEISLFFFAQVSHNILLLTYSSAVWACHVAFLLCSLALGSAYQNLTQ